MKLTTKKMETAGQLGPRVTDPFVPGLNSLENLQTSTYKIPPISLMSSSLAGQQSLFFTVAVEVGALTGTDSTPLAQMEQTLGVWESVANNATVVDFVNLTELDSVSDWTGQEIGALVAVSLMVPFILLSNIMVILCVVRYRRLHNPTNYFIASLAAVDLFVAVATPFGVVIEVFNVQTMGGQPHVLLCLLPNRVLMMACGVSLLTLAAIAYDRHTALFSPLEYVTVMTPRKVICLVCLCWTYSTVVVWFPVFLGWYSLPSVMSPCSAALIQANGSVVFMSVIFLPACLVILVCYFRIFLVARHHVKAIAAVELSVHRHLRMKFIARDTKYAKTLGLVIGAFLTLWLPYLIFVFVQSVSSLKFDSWVQTYLTLLAVFNSGVNPWIYAFMNSELRAGFKRLLRELSGERLCLPTTRCSALVSTINVSPRLSLTDSRMAPLIQNVAALDSRNEKLLKGFQLVNECAKHSISSYDNLCLVSPFNKRAEPPALTIPSIKDLRQTASCSNLGAINTSTPVTRKYSLIDSRSPSVGYMHSKHLLVNSPNKYLTSSTNGSRFVHQGHSACETQKPSSNMKSLTHASCTESQGCGISSPPVNAASPTPEMTDVCLLEPSATWDSVINLTDHKAQESLTPPSVLSVHHLLPHSDVTCELSVICQAPLPVTHQSQSHISPAECIQQLKPQLAKSTQQLNPTSAAANIPQPQSSTADSTQSLSSAVNSTQSSSSTVNSSHSQSSTANSSQSQSSTSGITQSLSSTSDSTQSQSSATDRSQISTSSSPQHSCDHPPSATQKAVINHINHHEKQLSYNRSDYFYDTLDACKSQNLAFTYYSNLQTSAFTADTYSLSAFSQDKYASSYIRQCLTFNPVSFYNLLPPVCETLVSDTVPAPAYPGFITSCHYQILV